MSRREVTTPSGEAWVVRRLWSPRLQGEHPWSRFRRRARGAGRRAGDMADADPGCLDLDDLLVGVVVVAVVLLAVFVVVPLLVAMVDLLVILVLTVLGLAARVVFRRPWVVEATRRGDTVRHTWRVIGWRASDERVDEVAGALAHGLPLPPDRHESGRPGA